MEFFFSFFFFFWGGGGGGGHYEIGLVFYFALFIFYLFIFFLGGGGSFLYILGIFKVKYRMRIFFGAAKFQIFLGMPDIPDFFFYFLFFFSFGGGVGGGKQKMLGPSLCMKKN